MHCNLCTANYIPYMDSFSCDNDFYYHAASLMSLLPFKHFLVAIATGYSLLFGEPVILRCVGGYRDLFSQVKQVCTRIQGLPTYLSAICLYLVFQNCSIIYLYKIKFTTQEFEHVPTHTVVSTRPMSSPCAPPSKKQCKVIFLLPIPKMSTRRLQNH